MNVALLILICFIFSYCSKSCNFCFNVTFFARILTTILFSIRYLYFGLKRPLKTSIFAAELPSLKNFLNEMEMT